jgi:hypothetical protein
MATWRELIEQECKNNYDSFDSLVITIENGELDREFNPGCGGTGGAPFTAWSDYFVYFPICYDGAEWCGSAPRNPCGIKCHHQGG